MNNKIDYILIGIDPGTTQTAYSIVEVKDNQLNKVLFKDKNDNSKIYDTLKINIIEYCQSENIKNININIAIEHIENHGMAVGQTTFETCYFIGALCYQLNNNLSLELKLSNVNCLVKLYRIYRHQEKTLICNNSRAKDSNIRQALIDQFGNVGTKNNQGYFYGFKSDIWSSFAIAYTWYLMFNDTNYIPIEKHY